MVAGLHKGDGFRTGEGCWVVEEVKGGEAPVDA